MNEFFRELIGIECNFKTTSVDYEGYILRDISGDWIVIEKDVDSVYLNLAHVISIVVA